LQILKHCAATNLASASRAMGADEISNGLQSLGLYEDNLYTSPHM